MRSSRRSELLNSVKIVQILALSNDSMDYLKRCVIGITVERLVGPFFSVVITSFQFVRNESAGDRYTSGLACVRESITSQLTRENRNGCDAVSKD